MMLQRAELNNVGGEEGEIEMKPGMQRGKAKLLMPGMERGQAKLPMMPEMSPMVLLKMAELNSSTEEMKTKLMHRR